MVSYFSVEKKRKGHYTAPSGTNMVDELHKGGEEDGVVCGGEDSIPSCRSHVKIVYVIYFGFNFEFVFFLIFNVR